MIGLSLSFCIKDICAGRIRLDDVEMIVSGTKAETFEQWDELVEHYNKIYWREFQKEANAVLGFLLDNNKIIQSRILTKDNIIPVIAYGRWTNSIDTHYFHIEHIEKRDMFPLFLAHLSLLQKQMSNCIESVDPKKEGFYSIIKVDEFAVGSDEPATTAWYASKFLNDIREDGNDLAEAIADLYDDHCWVPDFLKPDHFLIIDNRTGHNIIAVGEVVDCYAEEDLVNPIDPDETNQHVFAIYNPYYK